jgi:hypothetical protein
MPIIRVTRKQIVAANKAREAALKEKVESAAAPKEEQPS